MQFMAFKDFAENAHIKRYCIQKNDCICIINDNIFDKELTLKICQKKTEEPDIDILLITKGTENSVSYLNPFFYITYREDDAFEQPFQKIDLIRCNEDHKKCMELISESLVYNLMQGTNLSMIEKHVSVLNLKIADGGCILFEKDLLSETKKVQIQIYLYITQGIFCLFYENQKTCIAFLFSSNRLEIADNKKIANFLHSLGLSKSNTGVSGVKHKLSQFHDAYIESMLDYENQTAGTSSILIQDNAINYTLSLVSEKITRSLEAQNIESLHQNIEDYMEFLFQLKSIHRVEVTLKLLHQLYERFYLIKDAQSIRDRIKEIETGNRITSELDTIYHELRKILNETMNMMSAKGIERNALIDQIYEYVKINYQQQIGLKEVADAFHVTPQYVCRLFAKYTCTNFSALLTYFRIYHAKLFLKNGLSIKESADICGFRDVGYFMKKFKSVTGMTANEFKSNSAKY